MMLKRETLASTITTFLYIIFFAGFFFSFRAVSSICMGLLLIAGICWRPTSFRNNLSQKKGTLLLVGCCIYFLLQLISLLLNSDQAATWKDIQLKSSVIVIPVMILLTADMARKNWNLLIRSYWLLLAAALLYCLLKSILNYQDTGNNSVFFYHEFVKPLRQHAVYFSVFVFVGLIFLIEKLLNKEFFLNTIFHYILIVFFSLSLFLLSSKLVLAFYLFSLLYYCFKGGRKGLVSKKILVFFLLPVLLTICTLAITRNPVSDRFRDMFRGDPGLASQEIFNPGVYFNGIQFRLLQLKLVPEILHKQNSWWTGVGAGKAQLFLDEQYISRNMYVGDGSNKDKGYLGYNTHNQFLESLLKNGIPGLIGFLIIFIGLLVMTWQKRQSGLFFIPLLLLAYSCIESVLETQYGITLFFFFPCWICFGCKEPTFERE